MSSTTAKKSHPLKTDLPTFERWIAVRERYRLSDSDIYMARAAGFGPTAIVSLMEKLEAKGKPFRASLTRLRATIRGRYYQSFGRLVSQAPAAEDLRAEMKRRRRQKKRRAAGT